MKVENFSYIGKKVFVGMDVHKKRYVIVAMCENVVVKKWSTLADTHAIAVQLKSFFAGAEIHSAYEAGFSGFSLHRVLLAQGIHNKVVNAASIEMKSNDKVKTDKRDAQKLAEQQPRLRAIYVPTEAEESKRALSRGREQAVERRKVIGNQLKMKLHYLGFNIPEGKKVSESFFTWVDQLAMSSENQFAISEYIDAWRQESKRIKRFDTELAKQAQKDPLECIYRSAPGVGAVSARVLSNELGDMTRFNNERQLYSSSGLTPSEHSSGESVRKGHISRQGSPRIRGILVEIAWRGIGEDASLKEFYLRVMRHRDSKRAIVAVARKILGRLRHCLKEKVEWQEQRLAEAA